MATALKLLLLLSNLFLMVVNGGQIGIEEAVNFKSVPGSFHKSRDLLVLQVPCKSARRSVLISVKIGGNEGERIIIQRIEEDAAVCSSPHIVLDIDQTPPETTAVNSGVGDHEKGRGGKGPDGGGPDDGGPDGGGGNDGDEENAEGDEKKRLNKLGKISVLIAVQTMTSLIAIPKEALSAPMKYVLYFAGGMDACAYIFCFLAILIRRRKPGAAAIMAALGASFAGVGFMLTMCLLVPANFLWVVAIPFLVLLSSLAILLLVF